MKTKRSDGQYMATASNRAKHYRAGMEGARNEVIAKWRWRKGKASRPIHVGAATLRFVIRKGKTVVTHRNGRPVRQGRAT